MYAQALPNLSCPVGARRHAGLASKAEETVHKLPVTLHAQPPAEVSH